uniref:Uncharacterized protein n=1 Tax=Micrurus lemniscatus lemniscatus TaxID=129467 RepID=A0A2D4JGM1_MICLE
MRQPTTPTAWFTKVGDHRPTVSYKGSPRFTIGHFMAKVTAEHPRSYLQLGPKVTAILTINCMDGAAQPPTHLPLPPTRSDSWKHFHSPMDPHLALGLIPTPTVSIQWSSFIL